MVRACERVRYAEYLASLLEELGRKLGSIVGQGLLGCSILVNPMEAELRRNHGGSCLLHHHDLSQLAEAIRHHQYDAMSTLGRRQRA